jgi:hypothetical protein
MLRIYCLIAPLFRLFFNVRGKGHLSVLIKQGVPIPFVSKGDVTQAALDYIIYFRSNLAKNYLCTGLAFSPGLA